MRTALSCYSGLLVGTMGVLYWVMFGTLHHNAAQRTAKVTQINTWQEIWLLHPDMHVYAYRCGCAHMQTDVHLPSSKHLIWVIAISGKNTASGQTLPPALPSAYAPSASPAHPLAFLLTAPLLFSFPHLYISSSQTAFLANFLTFQPSFHLLFVSFHPCTCGHVTTEACSADKLTVS